VRGTAFLRAIFFKHKAASGCPEEDPEDATKAYIIKAQQMSVGFKKTFLDQDSIEKAAGEKAYERMRNEAIGWAALIALIFTAMQTLSIAADRFWFSPQLVASSSDRLDKISERITALERLSSNTEMERTGNGTRP
jgi:hypothetical protein